MPYNKGLLAKAKNQATERRQFMRLKDCCVPKKVHLYNIVERDTDRVVKRNVTMEDFTAYGSAMRAYYLGVV